MSNAVSRGAVVGPARASLAHNRIKPAVAVFSELFTNGKRRHHTTTTHTHRKCNTTCTNAAIGVRSSQPIHHRRVMGNLDGWTAPRLVLFDEDLVDDLRPKAHTTLALSGVGVASLWRTCLSMAPVSLRGEIRARTPGSACRAGRRSRGRATRMASRQCSTYQRRARAPKRRCSTEAPPHSNTTSSSANPARRGRGAPPPGHC